MQSMRSHQTYFSHESIVVTGKKETKEGQRQDVERDDAQFEVDRKRQKQKGRKNKRSEQTVEVIDADQVIKNRVRFLELDNHTVY